MLPVGHSASKGPTRDSIGSSVGPMGSTGAPMGSTGGLMDIQRRPYGFVL